MGCHPICSTCWEAMALLLRDQVDAMLKLHLHFTLLGLLPLLWSSKSCLSYIYSSHLSNLASLAATRVGWIICKQPSVAILQGFFLVEEDLHKRLVTCKANAAIPLVHTHLNANHSCHRQIGHKKDIHFYTLYYCGSSW